MRAIEIFLIQIVFYLALWLLHDFLATLLSFIIGGLALLTLLFSLVVELVERSKVPRSYFSFLILSFLAPLLAALIFLMIYGLPEWVDN